MRTLRLAMIATLLFATAISLFSILLPVPVTWRGSPLFFHVSLIISVFIPAMHVIAALFFFLGLQGFKQELRRAYQLVAAGIVILGFSLLASPLVTFLDQWDKWPMTLGLVNPPYIVAMTTVFVGIRVIFRVLGIQSRWRSLWLNALVVMGGVLLVVVAPHTTSNLPEVTFDFGNALFALTTFLSLVTAVNIFTVRRHLAPAYAKALTWLGVGIMIELSLVGTSVIIKLLGFDTRSSAGNLQNVLLLAGVPYLVAGYLFYRLTADIRVTKVQQDASPIDAVLYAGSLASSTEAVDPILDGLRAVTSRLEPGQPLSEQDQIDLANVYLQLERYLTEREPLRAFTASQLRILMHQRYKNGAGNEAFWGRLPLPTTATIAAPQAKPVQAS